MRKTKGLLNGEEFVKIKPDLPEHGVRGIVTAEIIDSKSGKVVQSCQSENIITDAFYRYAIMDGAEDFINGLRTSSTSSVFTTRYFAPGNASQYRVPSFGLLTLAKTGKEENANVKSIDGEIAGTAVFSNNVSRAEIWAGNLRNPQSAPSIDSNGNFHISRKFEFGEPKIVGRPFDTLYWSPHYVTTANEASAVPNTRILFDNTQIRAINGTQGFYDNMQPTLLQSVTYTVPADVTLEQWGTRWADLPYCFARGYITTKGATASLVILKYNTKTGTLLDRQDFTTNTGSWRYAPGRNYVGFIQNVVHPVLGGSAQFCMVRCNNPTGDIEFSAPNANYNYPYICAVDEDGNFRFGNSVINFTTGLITKAFTAETVNIPQWLYPASGVRPAVNMSDYAIYPGVDTFDVQLTGTYFGNIYVTFDNNTLSYKSMQTGTALRWRGISIEAVTATYSTKSAPSAPTVMYKFPATLQKTAEQVLIITYEIVLPSEVIDITKNFLW